MNDSEKGRRKREAMERDRVRSFVRSRREGKGRREGDSGEENGKRRCTEREKDADVPNLPQLRLDFRGSILIGSI